MECSMGLERYIPLLAPPASAWSNWQIEQNACMVKSPVLHNAKGRAVSYSRRCVDNSMAATSMRVRAEGANKGSSDASMAKGV